MNVHSYPSRAATAIAAAALLVCTSMAPAQASTTARAASASQTTATGTWGAVATQRTGAPYGTGQLKLTFRNTGSTTQPVFTPQYFNIANTGTLDITHAGYTGTTVSPSTVQFIVESCSGTWNESTGACQGAPGTTAATLTSPWGSSTTSVTSSTVPAGAGKTIRLRARITTNGTVPTTPAPTLTIGVTVNGTQVRTPMTTGS